LWIIEENTDTLKKRQTLPKRGFILVFRKLSVRGKRLKNGNNINNAICPAGLVFSIYFMQQVRFFIAFCANYAIVLVRGRVAKNKQKLYIKPTTSFWLVFRARCAAARRGAFLRSLFAAPLLQKSQIKHREGDKLF